MSSELPLMIRPPRPSWNIDQSPQSFEPLRRGILDRRESCAETLILRLPWVCRLGHLAPLPLMPTSDAPNDPCAPAESIDQLEILAAAARARDHDESGEADAKLQTGQL
jgi:hypothetical protein